MAEKKEKVKKEGSNINIEEMAKAGLHFGHRTSRIHPKMTPYIYGVRNGVHIIDAEKIKEKFEEALAFIRQLISENKILLFVGTKIQVKEAVRATATECGLPYISERWLGGTFTNFESIAKRVKYFKELGERKAKGEFEKYTKKEKAEIEKELQKLESKFGGIKNLEKLPDAVFICDMKKDSLAVKEAKLRGIKVIAIADTNIDPTLADYPIPANDDAVSSVTYVLDKIKEVVLGAKPKK